MELSDGEKVILLMLCDLAERGPAKASPIGNIDPKFVRSAIVGGHYWALDWTIGNMIGAPKRREDLDFVTDVLDMWTFIKISLAEMDATERDKLEKATLGGLEFAGFDGNEEADLMSIASFLIEMGRFTNFDGHRMNSHHPVAQRYGKMLARFKPLRATLAHRRLTSDQIAHVVGID